MVCCANYWRRHAIDAPGRVGTQLQKILFFLSALTLITFLTCNPLVVLGSTVTLVVYGIGIHGAQKRDTRALGLYGSITLFSVILSMIVVAFVGGFLLIGGARMAHLHHNHPAHAVVMREHAHMSQSTMSAVGEHMASNVIKTAMDKQWVIVDDVTATANDGQTFELITIEPNGEQQSAEEGQAEAEAEVEAEAETQVGAYRRSNRRHFAVEPQMRITGLGWSLIALSLLVSLGVFALKVRTIRLAFQMRAMLVSQERNSLPLSARRVQRSATPLAPPKPTPMRRRDCARCTFVNAPASQRCAMCDTPLPFAAAPRGVAPPSDVPQVYVPGNLFPLNTPLN